MFAGKISKSAGALICVSLLTACATGKRDTFTVGSVPGDYTQRHPIVLSEKENTLDVPVASSAVELNAATISNIKAFAGEFANSGTGSVIILLPTGAPNEAAVHRVKDQIVHAVQSGGGIGHVMFQSYNASQHGAAAPVRLSYRAVTASTSDCNKWSDDLTDTRQNTNYADFGCSTQNNLGAQIANPGDLLGPRKMSPIDNENRSNVITEYRGG